jgi:hypothetical protein
VITKKLIGKWQWIESSGGMAGEIMNPKTEKYQIQIEYNKKGMFKQWKDDQLEYSYKYQVKKGKSIFSQEADLIISYIPKPTSKIALISDCFEFIGNDTLMLKNECYDCYARLFVRKK